MGFFDRLKSKKAEATSKPAEQKDWPETAHTIPIFCDMPESAPFTGTDKTLLQIPCYGYAAKELIDSLDCTKEKQAKLSKILDGPVTDYQYMQKARADVQSLLEDGKVPWPIYEELHAYFKQADIEPKAWFEPYDPFLSFLLSVGKYSVNLADYCRFSTQFNRKVTPEYYEALPDKDCPASCHFADLWNSWQLRALPPFFPGDGSCLAVRADTLSELMKYANL